ncbi:MAG TPA: IclR family transcriptional regulator [Candidatus Eremiobacteraceae bacterium]|nr:IclR family transcriptional regulator [Candidatus Eremiobacteraceae bacterium]
MDNSGDDNATRPKRERTGVQSVERTLDILESLVEFGSEVGLVEISQAVGLPLATVHRLLGTLIARGYVKQNHHNRKYSLGFRALQMGNDMRQRFSLRLEARPFLQRLVQRVGESANLAVLDDGEVVYIDQAQSSRILRMFTQVGNRLPAHSTGSGKAMLAFSPPEIVNGILRRLGMPARTAHTITDPDRFRAELTHIRDVGYALDDEEHEEGVRCLAVPVRDGSGQVVASLSVSGPVTRLNDQQIGDVVPELIDSGVKLSGRLGFAAEPAAAR